MAGVLVTPPTLLLRSPKGGKALVVGVQEFRADALRLWGCQSFEAMSASHSHVGAVAPSRLAGAVPHLPILSGRWREWCLPVPDKPAGMLNTSHAAPAQLHRDTDASAGRGTS